MPLRYTLILFAYAACSNQAPSALDDTDTPVDTGYADTDPWPDDGANWTQRVSIVSNGVVLAPGDTLRATTAPAGVDFDTFYALTLTNRTDEALTFPSDPTTWLDTEGFSWVSPPPTSLEPEASALLSLTFNPVETTTATVMEATLTIPVADDALSLTLAADVPRPLRMVLVGNHGYTLISDSYGASFEQEVFPMDSSGPETTLGVVWGDGTFVRYGRQAGWSSDATYEYSSDGLNWSPANVASGAWAFDCAYGQARFLCARGYGGYLTSSESGQLFIHDATNGVSTFVQAVTFSGNHFIGAGRNGLLAISDDFAGFGSYISDSTRGDYDDIASADGLTVAVGGYRTAGYTLSTSSDDGLSWTHQRWEGGNTYDGLRTIVHEDGLWLVQGSTGPLPVMLRSTNGLDWEDLETAGVTTSYQLLGGHNGWIFGRDDDQLFRTRDGVTWDLIHTFADEHRPVGFAAETWEAP